MWKQELPTVAGVALVVISIAAVVAELKVSAAAAVLAKLKQSLAETP